VTFAGSGEAAGETPAGVVAIFDPDSLVLAAPALVSYDRLAAAAPHAGDTGAFVALADGVTVDRARPALRAALADFPTAQLLDADAVTARVQSGANRLLGLVFGLLFLSIVITLFGITNTLGLSVLERTRELGLLRGVGMTRVQTRAMVRWESVIVAVLGGLLGLAVGGLFGWVAVRALPAEFEAFAFPAGRLLAAAAVAVLAGVLAAVIPARRASRIDVLRAVTVE
jgi:putative ABC transport system permease protein